ncbi:MULTISPECIES: hypothetical protein [unclassified Helicobacter]|uniref:hypothetical protein n=1 Tax=unclassified Helicobacter TaxID=2593540 RepID=UPI000CF16584|nr:MULTISPECIES: hypothetical protein [unclassified Helicobacter]
MILQENFLKRNFLEGFYEDLQKLKVFLFEDDIFDEDEEDYSNDDASEDRYYNGYDDDDYQNPDSDYEDE